MVIHTQHSDRSKVFYDLLILDNGDGTITCPSGSAWVDGVAYPLPLFTPTIGTAPFGLFLEQIGGAADYVLDLTGEGQKTAFRPQVLPKVAWRDADNGEIHVLRSFDA